MGNVSSFQEGGIAKASPLGCILKHWGKFGKDPLMRKKLIEYCNQWGPSNVLEDKEQWPKNGTLKYNTILQLMLFCRREGKWDDVPYVGLLLWFFTLRNDCKSRQDCGLIVKDTNVLALEQETVKSRLLKRCCPACSIDKRCDKCKEEDAVEEEDSQSLVAAPREERRS